MEAVENRWMETGGEICEHSKQVPICDLCKEKIWNWWIRENVFVIVPYDVMECSDESGDEIAREVVFHASEVQNESQWEAMLFGAGMFKQPPRSFSYPDVIYGRISFRDAVLSPSPSPFSSPRSPEYDPSRTSPLHGPEDGPDQD